MSRRSLPGDEITEQSPPTARQMINNPLYMFRLFHDLRNDVHGQWVDDPRVVCTDVTTCNEDKEWVDSFNGWPWMSARDGWFLQLCNAMSDDMREQGGVVTLGMFRRWVHAFPLSDAVSFGHALQQSCTWVYYVNNVLDRHHETDGWLRAQYGFVAQLFRHNYRWY